MVTWWGAESRWYPQSWLHFSAKMLGVQTKLSNADWPLLSSVFQDSSIARAVCLSSFSPFTCFFNILKEKMEVVFWIYLVCFSHYNDGCNQMQVWIPFQLLSRPGSWKMHVWSNLKSYQDGTVGSHPALLLVMGRVMFIDRTVYLKSIQPSRPR